VSVIRHVHVILQKFYFSLLSNLQEFQISVLRAATSRGCRKVVFLLKEKDTLHGTVEGIIQDLLRVE